MESYRKSFTFFDSETVRDGGRTHGPKSVLSAVLDNGGAMNER